MTQPIEVDLPHRLGKAAAKQRIEGGFGKLAGFIPGGHVAEHQWTGDTLHFVAEGMGQRVAVRLDVGDSNVHASFELPRSCRRKGPSCSDSELPPFWRIAERRRVPVASGCEGTYVECVT